LPAKNVRDLLVDSFNVWLQLPNDIIDEIKNIVRMLHNASLIIDDIEDGSKLRRGSPVAHSLFGVASTINAGNYIYFQALSATLKLDSTNPLPEGCKRTNCIGVFTEELLNLHRGQGQDIVWRDENNCPSLEDYEAMVLDKTGGLFRLAVGLMTEFTHSSSTKGDFGPLVAGLALYFQVRDDLINLASEDYFKEKGFCEDLIEGKYSYPIIHCLSLSTPSSGIVRNVLKRRTEDKDVLAYARSMMLKEGR